MHLFRQVPLLPVLAYANRIFPMESPTAVEFLQSDRPVIPKEAQARLPPASCPVDPRIQIPSEHQCVMPNLSAEDFANMALSCLSLPSSCAFDNSPSSTVKIRPGMAASCATRRDPCVQCVCAYVEQAFGDFGGRGKKELERLLKRGRNGAGAFLAGGEVGKWVVMDHRKQLGLEVVRILERGGPFVFATVIFVATALVAWFLRLAQSRQNRAAPIRQQNLPAPNDQQDESGTTIQQHGRDVIKLEDTPEPTVEHSIPGSTFQHAAPESSVQQDLLGLSVQQDILGLTIQQDAHEPTILEDSPEPTVQQDSTGSNDQRDAPSPGVQQDSTGLAIQQYTQGSTVQQSTPGPTVQQDISESTGQQHVPVPSHPRGKKIVPSKEHNTRSRRGR